MIQTIFIFTAMGCTFKMISSPFRYCLLSSHSLFPPFFLVDRCGMLCMYMSVFVYVCEDGSETCWVLSRVLVSRGRNHSSLRHWAVPFLQLPPPVSLSSLSLYINNKWGLRTSSLTMLHSSLSAHLPFHNKPCAGQIVDSVVLCETHECWTHIHIY